MYKDLIVNVSDISMLTTRFKHIVQCENNTIITVDKYERNLVVKQKNKDGKFEYFDIKNEEIIPVENNDFLQCACDYLGGVETKESEDFNLTLEDNGENIAINPEIVVSTRVLSMLSLPKHMKKVQKLSIYWLATCQRTLNEFDEMFNQDLQEKFLAKFQTTELSHQLTPLKETVVSNPAEFEMA